MKEKMKDKNIDPVNNQTPAEDWSLDVNIDENLKIVLDINEDFLTSNCSYT